MKTSNPQTRTLANGDTRFRLSLEWKPEDNAELLKLMKNLNVDSKVAALREAIRFRNCSLARQKGLKTLANKKP